MRVIVVVFLAFVMLWVTPRVLAIHSTTTNNDHHFNEHITYPPDNIDLTGDWLGADRTSSGFFTFTLQITQTGNIFFGMHVWSNGPIGTISGTIDGINVTWTRYDLSSTYTANFTGTISSDEGLLYGVWKDNALQIGIWQAIKLASSPYTFLDLPYDYTNSTFYDQSREASQDGHIDSFFDHMYPTSNDPPNLGLEQTVNFNGYISPQTLPLPSYEVVADGNDGTNFKIPTGTPVLAAAVGTVTFRGQVSAYCELTNQVETANVIKVLHANRFVSEYWHLSSFAPGVVTGTVVTRDIAHPIGYAGDTGCTSGPLLNFILRNPAGVVVDPYGWRPLPQSAWYNATDPWKQYNADNGGVDAVSHYLWLKPLNTITITLSLSPTVLSSPSHEITISLPSGVYSEPLRLELSETLQPALITGFQSLRTFTFFGITNQGLVLTHLETPVIIDFETPVRGEALKPILWVWYDQLSNWVAVPTIWDNRTGLVHAVTARIGSFALTNGLPQTYLPLTLKP